MEINLFFFIVSKYGFIGLIKNEKFISSKYFDIENDLSEKIVFLVDEFLKSNKLSWDDINSIYSNLEPGRHTFTRVMASFLRMIKVMKKNVNIYLINTLKLLAGKNEVITSTFITKKQLDIAHYKNQNQVILFKKMDLEKIEKLMKTKFKNLNLITDESKVDIKKLFFESKDEFKLTKFNEIKPEEFKLNN